MSESVSPTAFETPNAERPGEHDPFGLDPEVRELVAPAFRFLHDRYWRIEVAGAEHVPAEGPVLLVANHSGALPFDGAMIVTAVDAMRGRIVRFLYDRFVEAVSPLDTFYRKVGGVVASRENAQAVLSMGDAVLLFPEGISGVAKPFSEATGCGPSARVSHGSRSSSTSPWSRSPWSAPRRSIPGRSRGRPREGARHAVPAHHAVFPASRVARGAPAADEVVYPLRQAGAHGRGGRGGGLSPGAQRGGAPATLLASNGHTAQESPPIGVLRMNGNDNRRPHTYLRVGAGVYPVYGDELRGWSPRADDFQGLASSSPYVYHSLDELFFALVNLCVSGSAARQPRQHAH